MHKLSDLEFLETLSENEIPEFLADLTPPQLNQLRTYVQGVVDEQNAGMDKLFQSMAMAIKFIPNFFLIGIIKQFIEPAIAARIAVTLPLKESLSLAHSMEPDYLGETSVHLPTDLTLKITSGLKPRLQEQVLQYMAQKHPLRALDIAANMPEKTKKILAGFMDLSSIDESHLIADSRKNTLHELQALSGPTGGQ